MPIANSTVFNLVRNKVELTSFTALFFHFVCIVVNNAVLILTVVPSVPLRYVLPLAEFEKMVCTPVLIVVGFGYERILEVECRRGTDD
jgi:hypothetical protein